MNAVLSPDRVGRITGSRIAGVLGLSPWATADDVMREMVRQACGAEPEFTGNDATRHGQAHEAGTVFAYEMMQIGDRTGFRVEQHGDQQQFWIHPKYDFLGVTPDGVVIDLDTTNRPVMVGAIEVKNPYWASFTTIEQVPHYKPQCMLVTECLQVPWVDFVVGRQGQPAVSTVTHDPEWLPKHLPVLEAFIAEYRRIMAYPELQAPFLAPLVDVVTDPHILELAGRYAELTATIETLKGDLDVVRGKLQAATGGRKFRAGPVQGWTSHRKGRVDFRKAAETMLPTFPELDLAEFTGPATDVFNLKVTR